MGRTVIYTCDRCDKEAAGVYVVDFGNDYTKPRDLHANKKRVVVELCTVCYESLLDWLKAGFRESSES